MALRRTSLVTAAGLSLFAVSTAALACDCSGDPYHYYRNYDDGSGNWSCYGGGTDCGYVGAYHRPYRHHYYGDYGRYRYDDRYRGYDHYREYDRDRDHDRDRDYR
jgi:hypothetical protein